MNNLIYVMMSRGYGWNLVRSLFAWLDTVVYTVFGWAMQLIFDIVEISGNPALQNFYEDIHTRIYGILAIFMLFKITVSLLTYLVDPDTINDKQRGIGKLIMRAILSLIMLIVFPIIFNFFLIEVQPHALEALPRIVLGVNSVDNETTGTDMQLAGDKISFSIYNGVWFNNNCADYASYNSQGLQANGCFKHSPEEGKTFMSLVPEHINDAADGDSSNYRYDYYPVIGLVVGIVMTLIIVGICIDVSIRLFKLIILQTIAPIPIMSYIDPKSSKDGAFSKWIKMVISVYLDLFIKLAVVYFMILVINSLIVNGVVQSITNSLFANNGTLRGGLVLVALVVGLLFFAKDAPKFISDALGIKTGENGKLFGGLGKVMAAGAIGAGAIGSTVASTRASFMSDAARKKGHNPLRIAKNIGAGLIGGVAGASAGAMAAVNAKDHHAKAVMDANAKRNALSLSRGASGSTFFGRVWTGVEKSLTGDSAFDKDQRAIESLDAKATTGKQLQEFLEDRAVKKGSHNVVSVTGKSYQTASGHTVTGISTSLDAFYREWNKAKQVGSDTFTINGHTFATYGSDAAAIEGDLKAMAGVEWAKTATGADKDTLDAYTKSFVEAAGSEARSIDVTNSDQVKGIRRSAERESFRRKNSDSYSRHKANSGNGKS